MNTRETEPVVECINPLMSMNTNDNVYAAVQIEYKEMASWYDNFWKSYTDATLKIPLNDVVQHIHRNNNIRENNNDGDDDRFTIVDVGCGTGTFLRRLLDIISRRRFSSISSSSRHDENFTRTIQLIGIEPSKEMLKEAHKKFDNEKDDEGEGGGKSVILKQSPAEQLPLESDSANVIVSTNAFHFFRNKERSLHEMKRVLKHNGTLIITDWCNDYWIVKLYHFLEKIRWNWRFKDKYPGPLTSCKLIDLVKSAGFCDDVEHTMYRVRVFGIFYWGMQTIMVTKRDR